MSQKDMPTNVRHTICYMICLAYYETIDSETIVAERFQTYLDNGMCEPQLFGLTWAISNENGEVTFDDVTIGHAIPGQYNLKVSCDSVNAAQSIMTIKGLNVCTYVLTINL